MWIQKVENGQPMVDAEGRAVMIEVPDPPSPEEISRRIQEAATAAATATRNELENARIQREQELEALMREREEAARIAALPEAQQVMERLRGLEESNRQLAQQRIQDAARHGQEIRQLGLIAYTERAVRDVPEEVVDLIGGASEEEIDASVDRALAAYKRISDRLQASFQAGVQQAQPPGTAQPVLVAPPRSQHVVVTPPPPPAGSFPLATNAPPFEVPPDPTDDVRGMTTEEAVRSGKYSGEMRKKMLDRVRGVQYPGAMGSAPRHWSQPVPHVQQPDGSLQPQGLSTPPAQNPHVRQSAPLQAQADPVVRQQAQEAASRARNSDVHLRQHLRSPAGKHLSTPQGAFDARFGHTPPIQEGQVG